MKLVRYIQDKELYELIQTGKVTPNTVSYQHNALTFNYTPTNIKLTLNLLRYQLEYEDGVWLCYKGYSLQNIKEIELNGRKATVSECKEYLSKRIHFGIRS